MIDGLLLDTHTQLWMEADQQLSRDAVSALKDARDGDALYSSDISIWELGVAQTKRNVAMRPSLNGLTPGRWMERFALRFSVTRLTLTTEVLTEAALVPAIWNYGDPGDCFLIATARVYDLSLLTRDRRILQLSHDRPDYITTIPC